MSTAKRSSASIGARRLITVLILACFPWTVFAGTEAQDQSHSMRTVKPTRRSPASILEDAYRDHLVAWAEGDTSRPEAYAEIEHWAIERIAGTSVTPQNFDSEAVLRGDECVREVAGATSRRVGIEDSEALFAIAVFEFELYYSHRENLRPGSAESGWQRVEDLRSRYRRSHTVTQATARQGMALQATYMASRLTTLTLRDEQHRALSLFEQALELEPGNIGAGYWVAFLREKFGLYKKAVVSFGQQAVLQGDVWEVRLRWALNLARTGSSKRAEELLAEVVARAQDDWVRIVAFQELARLRMARDKELGLRTLRRGIKAYPQDEQLGVALAFYLGPASAEGQALVRELHAPTEPVLGLAASGGNAANGGEEDPEPVRSPRLRYEEPRLVDLARELERFVPLLAEKQRALVAAIEAVRKAERLVRNKRLTTRACRALRPPEGKQTPGF